MKLKTKNTEQPVEPLKVKGIAWLLDGCEAAPQKENSGREIQGIVKAMQQSRKWKKNTANRFAGFSRNIERTVENKLKQEDRNYNGYQYDSLRKAESNWNHSARASGLCKTFHC